MAFDMYQEIILQHYRNPRNFGPLDHADLAGEESNPLCGDRIRLELQVDRSTLPRITGVGFSGDGCAISVASASMLTEKLKGLSLEEARHLQRDDVLKLVGIPLSPVRVKCALTGFAALGRALAGETAEPSTPAKAVTP
jgi:nitrogen fixation protein NifU and related proteins